MRILTLIAAGGCLLAVGCDQFTKKKTTTPTTPHPVPAETPAVPPGGGNTNYQPGAGVATNVRQAAKRAVALNDMKTLGTAIFQWETENNRMPTRAEILEMLKQYPNILTLVNEGSIILTGTTDRAGLWAYEFEADKRGGIGLVAGTPNRYDAATIKQYLNRR